MMPIILYTNIHISMDDSLLKVLGIVIIPIFRKNKKFSEKINIHMLTTKHMNGFLNSIYHVLYSMIYWISHKPYVYLLKVLGNIILQVFRKNKITFWNFAKVIQLCDWFKSQLNGIFYQKKDEGWQLHLFLPKKGWSNKTHTLIDKFSTYQMVYCWSVQGLVSYRLVFRKNNNFSKLSIIHHMLTIHMRFCFFNLADLL